MPIHRSLAVLSLSALTLAPQAPGAALASNTPICIADQIQSSPVVVSDGAGGAIVAWSDFRNGTHYDIYAQHVMASGSVDAAWPPNGVVLCAASGNQDHPAIISDGAGGAIVAWRDFRNIYPVYAQRVLASGVVDPSWPPNGLGVGGSGSSNGAPAIVSDGAGGAVVAWSENRGVWNGSNFDMSYQIYANRMLASGTLAGWPVGGVPLCTLPGDQTAPTIVSNTGGGAYVAWQDQRSGTNYDIYAQHVLGSGAIADLWPANGIALTFAPGDQFYPVSIIDGAGGAFVAWTDMRGADADIYCQRVLNNSNTFTFWGQPVCTASGDQWAPAIVADGANGAIISWHDRRSGNADIYAQRMAPLNTVDAAWPANGRALCTAVGNQDGTAITSDGAGGAIVTWSDLRGADYDIYAQHVLASGVVDGAWPADGAGLGVFSQNQWLPRLAPDGSGGAITVWQDYRNGPNADIYAAASTALVDVPRPDPPRRLAFASPWPSPAREAVALRIATPREGTVSLAIYDAGGRRVRLLISGSLPAGERTWTWDLRNDAGRHVPPGLYFAALETERERIVRRFAVLR